MTRTACTEHPSCTLPAVLRRSDCQVVDHSATAERKAYTSVEYNGRVLGTMVDRGYVVHATQEWRAEWNAFAGGNAVIIPEYDGSYHANRYQDKEYVAKCIIEHATTAAFHFRMALHSCY